MQAATSSLAESQHNIPDGRETKASEKCFVPDLVPSQSQSPSPDLPCPTCNNGVEDTHTDQTTLSLDDDSVCDEAMKNVDEVMKECNTRDVDNKHLNLLNPFHMELEEDVTYSGRDKEDHSSQEATDSVQSGGSLRDGTVHSSLNGAKDEALPNSHLVHTQEKPEVDSFYNAPSQDKKDKQTTVPNSLSEGEETQHAPPHNKLATMEEMVDLRAVDLQESQVEGMTGQDITDLVPSLTQEIQ